MLFTEDRPFKWANLLAVGYYPSSAFSLAKKLSQKFLICISIRHIQNISTHPRVFQKVCSLTTQDLDGPGVSLYLLHEDTGHLWLPRVKLAQVWSSVNDAVSMVPRGWDFGPTILMGPSPRPSWAARSNGQFHEGQPLYIHISRFWIPTNKGFSEPYKSMAAKLWRIVGGWWSGAGQM